MRINDIGAGEDQPELALPFQFTTAIGSKAADIVSVIYLAQHTQDFGLGVRTHGEDRGKVLEAK